MASPKNWSRRHKKPGETSWEHDELPLEVVVEDLENASHAEPGENWEAWLNFKSEKFEYSQDHIDFDKTFRTRDSAESFAVSWMRDHPLDDISHSTIEVGDLVRVQGRDGQYEVTDYNAPADEYRVEKIGGRGFQDADWLPTSKLERV